jgi:hypothetical protein
MKKFLFASLLPLLFIACKPGGSAEEKQPTPAPPPIESPDTNKTIKGDTNTVPTESNDPEPEEKPLVKAAPKICDPNFTKLASPKNNQHIYYVTNFNPGEFKCWVKIEEFGIKTCDGTSCVLYFLDKANIKANSTPPHYLDENTLKTNGIGRFEYNGKYWEIKGANMWKRKDKGYGYYNTDNQLGG